MYQLYMSKDEKVNKDLFKRCRDNGYSAICLTTDTQLLGKRESDFRIKFQLPSHLTLEILKKYQMKASDTGINASKGDSALAEFVKYHKNNDIEW